MISRYWSKPMIPLLIINSSLNQQKAANFIRQLQRIKYSRAKAIGMVIDINNHMPVQIDKIAEYLEDIRQEYNIKIYGFCHSNVTLGKDISTKNLTIFCQKPIKYILILLLSSNFKEEFSISLFHHFSLKQAYKKKL